VFSTLPGGETAEAIRTASARAEFSADGGPQSPISVWDHGLQQDLPAEAGLGELRIKPRPVVLAVDDDPDVLRAV
jgi:hypothetical protein